MSIRNGFCMGFLLRRALVCDLGYRINELEPHIRSREQWGHPDCRPFVQACLDAHTDAGQPQ